ncbi:hypothetical protein NECAME_03897 [Necator americanus]|uniref:Uncharacterized protein n=1 Tax=Necator americanus TaxID=51031 RepID=W2SYP5_NECAM|nr:hypothetical protein NECAME_03897 [Necator americanus]ETN74765.1 hypothetical protein NECAME_03897 [Necator americanus]
MGTNPPSSTKLLVFFTACPPALSSGKSAMSGGSMQKTFHEAMRQRRTSLPANSLTFGKMQNVQSSNVSEARGLVVDMMANRDLPPNVVSCLRAVATLLNPHTPLSLHSFNDFGLPCVVENPYSGEQLIVSNVSCYCFVLSTSRGFRIS